MGITNGQPVDEDFTNPAFLDRRQDDTAFGVYTWANTTDPLSGASVINHQRHINEGHQDEKTLLNTATHQKIGWDGTQVSCPEDVQIRFPDGPNFVNTILAANFPLNLSDGQSAYVTLNRYASVTVTLSVTSNLPKGKDIFRLVTRVGTSIILWDNTLISTGGSAAPGGASGGVTSFAETGDTPVQGDVEVEEGTNITIQRIGNKFRFSALGGGGGGGISYSESQGNVDITLRPAVQTQWVLQSPDLTFWYITIANDGTVTATSGALSALSNIKVTKPDLSEASFAITNLGELQVVSPPAGGETLNDSFFLASPDGHAWRVTATDADEFQIETDSTDANRFRILNDVGQELFRIQEVNGLATHYIPVFNSSTLPASPTVVSGTLPWAFYDTGSVKRPIFWDGSAWIYFADNAAV